MQHSHFTKAICLLTLQKFDDGELASVDKRVELEASLMNRDRAVASVDLGVKIEAVLVEAVPELKQVNLYWLEGNSIKRDEHLKAEKMAEVTEKKNAK